MSNDEQILSQEEIESLIKAHSEEKKEDSVGNKESEVKSNKSGESTSKDSDLLSPEEVDALGEVGNISMGSAATTLSDLLNQKVNITSPRVWLTTKKELIESFTDPYLIIKVDFIERLKGFNILLVKAEDALIIADLMMGGEGKPTSKELSDIEISAASEAMNMMIGAAATSLSQLFNKPVNISPPESMVIEKDTKLEDIMPELTSDENLVVVSFKMTIGDLVDTELMQGVSLETAKEKAALLWGDVQKSITEDTSQEIATPQMADGHDEKAQSESTTTSAAAGMLNANLAQDPSVQTVPNLDLILDIPLKVSVVLGRTKKHIKEVLNMGPGTLVELDAMVDEPVEILVNGVLVAEGEVVAVNENFGVKITNIISPIERIKRLTK